MTKDETDEAMVWVEASYECGYEQGVLMGMPLGVAVCYGIIEMAKMIAARERAKPFEPHDYPVLATCKATSGRYRCNLDHDDERHKAIGRTGNVLHSWTDPDRGLDSHE